MENTGQLLKIFPLDFSFYVQLWLMLIWRTCSAFRLLAKVGVFLHTTVVLIYLSPEGIRTSEIGCLCHLPDSSTSRGSTDIHLILRNLSLCCQKVLWSNINTKVNNTFSDSKWIFQWWKRSTVAKFPSVGCFICCFKLLTFPCSLTSTHPLPAQLSFPCFLFYKLKLF